jgi:hypothetical protein
VEVCEVVAGALHQPADGVVDALALRQQPLVQVHFRLGRKVAGELLLDAGELRRPVVDVVAEQVEGDPEAYLIYLFLHYLSL